MHFRRINKDPPHLDNGRVFEASQAACIPASSFSCSLDLCRASARLCHGPFVQNPYADRWMRHTCWPCHSPERDSWTGQGYVVSLHHDTGDPRHRDCAILSNVWHSRLSSDAAYEALGSPWTETGNL